MQIHLMAGGAVRIFSRNCEDRTPSFPDVADIVRAAAAGECPFPLLLLDVVPLAADECLSV